jgi:multidrug efflux pump subunit AcrB
MGLIRAALRRPISVIVIVIGVSLCAWLAIARMRIDIFPNLNLPVIYVAQPYGGMSPAQMEGYVTYYYEYHFLYINGIESVESKSIQGTALLKLAFHPGTDMSQALSQTISYVNRARAFMPPGTVAPFVIRFDAGTVPVGYLVFSSETRRLTEIQDLALNRIRPLFATLPGLTSPPPFGGSQRTIVINVNPDRLRAYNMSPDEVVRAVTAGNVLMPAGSMQSETLQRIVPTNAIVSNIRELADLPVRSGAGPTVFVRDIGTVEDGADILAGYALVNGRRAVYIPVTKRPDASTLTVVDEVRQNLARFQSLVPGDIHVSYEFDQSASVKAALLSVVREGLLGALLTGLAVWLFLRDWRSSLIVIVTIPLALVSAVVALWATGQTINIMTLGGLALAVGILVDEGTVVIENIHSHLARGGPKARAVLDGSGEVALPNLLAMLCVLAVFAPALLMTGVSQALFVPLSLAVAFAMAASFFLSRSLVPVLSVWMLRPSANGHAGGASLFSRGRDWWTSALKRLAPGRWLIVAGYLAVAAAAVGWIGPRLGQQLFPSSAGSRFLLRFRAPIGTRVPETEQLTLQVLDQIQQMAGPGNVQGTLGYVGVQASSYPINTVFLWTSGPHDAVINIALRPEAGIDIEAFEEKLRVALPGKFPGCQFSFGAGDIVSQIMNFGAPTPLEIATIGGDLGLVRDFAEKVRTQLSRIDALRDLQVEQPLDYPSTNVRIDRERAGQLGVTTEQVARSVVAATSSSRFVTPNYWADPRTGVAYQIQVQVPQARMGTRQDLGQVPVMPAGAPRPLLGDLAQITDGTVVGEYDRVNGQRMVTLSANVAGGDLGRVATAVDRAIKEAGTPPAGITVKVRGQVAPMNETFANLGTGLLLAIVVVFLLLAANFQSLRLAFVVLSTVPAVLAGVVFALLVTGTTVNVQSFMGAIMAIGVAIANAILVVTFAERFRRGGEAATAAAVLAVGTRMRPVLMTSLTMIAGMVPMALAIGEGAEAAAPLGRAVIGGLSFAAVSTLTVLPFVYGVVQGRARRQSASLDPDDAESAYFGRAAVTPGGAEPT